MTTVHHKDLTGLDIHEPKGISSATSGQIYVADGASSGAWISNSPFLVVSHQVAVNTAGGTVAATTDVTRTLNTTNYNTITGASLASNQITLPAGTYLIEGVCQAHELGNHRIKLYNTTDSSITLEGLSTRSGTGVTDVSIPAAIKGIFTITGTKVLEIRHYSSSGKTSDGMGVATNHGAEPEVYAVITIRKL